MCFFFFFTPTPTTEIYTLSLHDALPILSGFAATYPQFIWPPRATPAMEAVRGGILIVAPDVVPDRKSTRLNSSHTVISYAVFCLKKKKKIKNIEKYHNNEN